MQVNRFFHFSTLGASLTRVYSAAAFLLLLSFKVAGQSEIDGPGSLQVNDEVQYYGPAGVGVWSISTGTAVQLLPPLTGESVTVRAVQAGPVEIRYESGGLFWYKTINVYNGPPPSPLFPPSVLTDVCGSMVLQRMDTPPNGIRYYWQNSSSTITDVFGYTATFQIPSSGTWYLRSRDEATDVWGGLSGGITVTIRSFPGPPATNTISRCGPGSISLTTTPGSNGTGISWYTSSTGGTPLSSSVVNVTSTINFYAATTNAGCESTSRSVVVAEVTPIAVTGVLNRLSPSQICAGTSFQVQATSNTGTPLYEFDYDDPQPPANNWVNVNTDYSGGNTLSYPANYEGEWRVRMRAEGTAATNTCGSGDWSDYVTFTVWAQPGVPTPAGPYNLCAGSSVQLAATPGSGAITVVYYSTGGSTINSLTPFGPLNETTTIYLSSQGNGGCESELVPWTFNVVPLPVNSQISASETSVCVGETVVLTTIGGSGNEFFSASYNEGQTWSVFDNVPGGNANTGFQHAPGSPGTIRYRVRNNQGCGYCGNPNVNCADNSFDYVDVSVSAPATFDNITGETLVVPGKTYTYSLHNPVHTSQITWSVENATLQSGQNSVSSTIIPQNVNGSVQVMVSNGECGPGKSAILYLRNGLNYIIEETALRSIKDPQTVGNREEEKVARTTTFFDGLSRSIQTVAHRNSPARHDFVQPILYDAFGRSSLSFLPFAAESSGWYKANEDVINSNGTYKGVAQHFYSSQGGEIANDIPSAVTNFEPSPLNRPIVIGAPGLEWQPGMHAVHKNYSSNATKEVLRFIFNTSSASLSLDDGEQAYYPANALFKNITVDEQQNDTIEFLDKEGRVVCRKVRSASNGYASTYYIYDAFGNLVVVLPPAAAEEIELTLTGD